MKEGVVVQLKSGGPEMTLSNLVKNDIWLCVWFVNGEYKEAHFRESSLIVVDDD